MRRRYLQYPIPLRTRFTGFGCRELVAVIVLTSVYKPIPVGDGPVAPPR